MAIAIHSHCLGFGWSSQAGYKLFEITLSRGDGDDQLREDLKAWCQLIEILVEILLLMIN